MSWLRFGALLAPVAIFLAFYLVHPPDEPLIYPDSDGYLNFSPLRSGGYPFLLALLKPLIRDPSDYSIAQLVLYAVAALALGRQILSTYENPLWCLLAELALLFNPLVNRFHFSILTESVFLSMSVLFLAAALAHLRTGSSMSLAGASAAAGYALAVRPTGLVFVAALAVLLTVAPDFRRHMAMRVIAAILPLVFCIGAESLYYGAHHPGPRRSLLPIQAFGKAGMVGIADPQDLINAASRNSRPLQMALELQLSPVRKLVRDAPDIAARCRLEANYETFVEYQFALPERAELVAAEGQDGVANVAFARLRRGVPDYLRLTADYYFCLWTLWATDNNEKAALAIYIDARKPLPFEADVLGSLTTSRSSPYSMAVKGGMLGIAGLLAVAGACLCAAVLRRRAPSLELAVGGLCGIVVHGGLLLSASTGVGIPRYTLGLWPPLALGVVFSLLWIGRNRRVAGRFVHNSLN